MNVLFLGNDASRTGAPIGLLHFLRWLRGQPDITFELLLRRSGGALQHDYEALCPVAGYDTFYTDRSLLPRVARRLGLRRLGLRSCLSASEQRFVGQGVDVIYANTIATGAMVADLARLDCPVVCHVHELQSAIDAYGPRNFAHLRRHTVHWIADSRATARNLVRNGIAAARVTVACEFITTAAVPAAGDAAARRRELGIPAGAFVVGGCGFRYHRKGKDLFVRMAQRLNAIAPEIDAHFVWIGGATDDEDARQLRRDIEAAQLQERVHVIPHVDDPFLLYPVFDLFAMVSREEPFGMVMLEAACRRCPTVCFRDVGGPEEFVEEDAGVAVPHLDVNAMAEAALALARNPARRESLGRRAQAKVVERHDVQVVAPQILAMVRAVSMAK